MKLIFLKLLLLSITFPCFASGIKFYNSPDAETHNESLSIYSRIGNTIQITGNLEQLKFFYESLSQTKTKKVRIAHFGDSLILGDIITADLRSIMQQKFGGNGIGFMPACNDDIMFKYTITHKFSDDWKWASVFTRNPNRYPLSINGIMSVAATSSWLSYNANRQYNAAKSFKDVRIFYDNTEAESNVKLKTEFDEIQLDLSIDEGVFNESFYKAEKEVNSIILEFENCENALIYGVSMENGPGIYVDNFAMRGNSGASLNKLDKNFLKESRENLDYSLIILNYGINIVEAGKTDYTWYKKRMIKNIKELKEIYPETSILLVSTGHKGVKRGSRIISDPIVNIVVETQKEIVKATGIAFWNLYDAMGSDNAIVEWVNAGYVAKDYIHFNQKGGRKVAEMLSEALLAERVNMTGN